MTTPVYYFIWKWGEKKWIHCTIDWKQQNSANLISEVW